VILEEYPDHQYLLPETDRNKIVDNDVELSHGDNLAYFEHTLIFDMLLIVTLTLWVVGDYRVFVLSLCHTRTLE
jgi:hypothetical protein